MNDLTTVRGRLSAFVSALLDEGKFNPMFKPAIVNLMDGFLKKASDDEIKKLLEDMRDKFIPFILTGEAVKDGSD